MMTTEENSNEVFEEVFTHFENDATPPTEPAIDVGISLQALFEGISFKTLLMEGKSKKATSHHLNRFGQYT